MEERDSGSTATRTELASKAVLDAGSEDVSAHWETVHDPRIPKDQQFFKIGEVSAIVGVKPYVLRYWETEFPWVKPEKTSTRQRRYRRQDVALLLQIKRLRYDEELPVARARELIRESRRRGGAAIRPPPPEVRFARPGAVATVKTPPLERTLEEMRAVVRDLLAAVEDAEGDK